jgi:hypothetical protein
VDNVDKKAGALNQVLKALLPELGENDTVMIMDADTVLRHGFLTSAVKHFEEDRQLLKVQGQTVTDILADHYKFPCTIDYASIDTEGAELEALQGIDFSKVDIRFLTIEHGNRKGYIEIFKEYLEPYGYSIHRINQWDVEFTR